MWYKWVFFNDDVICWNLPGTCLTDKPPIDGNRLPFEYTTYFNWLDFFDRDEIEVIMWILVVTSFLGYAAWPVEVVFTGIFQGYMIWNSVVGWFDVLLYENDTFYTFDLSILLFMTNFYNGLAMTAFLVNMLFPLIGPLGNIMIMYWVMIEWERLQLPLWVSQDDAIDEATS